MKFPFKKFFDNSHGVGPNPTHEERAALCDVEAEMLRRAGQAAKATDKVADAAAIRKHAQALQDQS